MTQDRRSFTVILEEEEDGGYSAYCPSLPGCISQGNNRAKALENIGEAIRIVLETLEGEAEVNDESTLRLQALRHALPYPETPTLIAAEMKRVLEARNTDGLAYQGISTDQVEVPVAVHY